MSHIIESFGIIYVSGQIELRPNGKTVHQAVTQTDGDGGLITIGNTHPTLSNEKLSANRIRLVLL